MPRKKKEQKAEQGNKEEKKQAKTSRSFWSGAISFGLINIPVKLYAATQERNLNLDMLRKGDLCPIKYARVCRATGEEVPYEDIVKGYEYQKGDYVVLEDEDLKKADVGKTQSIQVVQFVDEDEIDVKYFEKPYYLEPGKGADKAYALLREALRRSKKVAVCRFVLRTKENVGALKAEGNVIVLEQMRLPSELRAPAGLDLPAKAEVDNRELDMALQLIDQLTEPFKPEDFRDTYREELEKIIAQKVAGKEPTAHGKPPEPTAVPDLMAALRASLERGRQNKPAPYMHA
ncbi:MAG: Ku protein [Rudaea sp.]